MKGLMALALGTFALSADALPTISPAPADGQFDANTTWYYWDAPRKGFGYIVNDDSYRNAAKTQFIMSNTTFPEGDAGLWCIVGNETDGYQFYNKAAGTGQVFGVESTGAADAKSNMYEDGTENVTTRFLFVDGEGASAGNYIIKLKRDDSGIRILNDRNEVDGVHRLALWENPNGDGWKSNDGSTFRFRTIDDFAISLPENFLTTDENNPNYFFIKNLRAADSGRYPNQAGKGQAPYVSCEGNGNMFTHVAVTSTASLYEPASTLWYFVSAGDKVMIDGVECQPVKIKNLIKPGLAFNAFSGSQFTADGTIFYVFNHKAGNYTGYAIVKKENDGTYSKTNQTAWSDHGGVNVTNIGYWKIIDSGNADEGAVFDFESAASDKIAASLSNYMAASRNSLSNTVKLFEQIMGATELSQAIKDKINTIVDFETLESVQSEIYNDIYPKLDRKVVYMANNGRETASKGKYIYLNKTTNKFVATDHKCVLGKWQFIHNGNGNNFILRNIATDTYVSAAGSFSATSATERRNSPYTFQILAHKDGKGFVLKFTGNNMCEKIDNADDSYLMCATQADPSNVTDAAYSFSFEAANIAASEITADDLYVIRSTRGKSDEDSYKYTAKYPGSLITAYPADRQLARERVGYLNGAHLEMYAPGSVWKFVKEGEGYKIYSLIGEQTNAADNKGLKVVEHDGVKYVDVMANPDVFYLKEISSADGAFMAANTYALCTAQNGGEYVTVTDENNHGDFFLTLSATEPTTATDDAASFFIESIGTTHDGANPTEEYKTYAKELHMFKSIAPVLNDEDMEYILAEKEDYDYTNISTIAAANEFMAKGKMTASSRAFQRLDGKMIRLQNRMPFGRYLYSNTSAAAQYNNPTATTADIAAQTLNSIWTVELPGTTDEEKIASARMRQLRLRNLATGAYVNAHLQTGETAQTLTVRRRASLDQTEFFLALTKDYERNTALMMKDNGADIPVASDETTWGANSSQYAHWSIETAVSAAVPTVTLTKHTEKDDTYVLTVAKPEGVTAMSLTGLTGLGKASVEKATVARELTEAAEVELTADADGNITGEIPAQLASATEDNNYTVKLPAALLAMDNNVSPAVEATVTVPSDPTLTGIKEVTAAEKGAEVIYDLQGRRVSKASKGVYIINGVKTLVK